MEKDTFMQHEDEIMNAFEKLKGNIKSVDDETNHASSQTQVVVPSKANGVIDREEWDRILAEADAKAAKNVANTEAKGDASVGSRSSRHASKTTKLSSSKKPKKKKKSKKSGVFKKVILAILGVCVVAAIVVGVMVAKIIKEAPEINPNNIYDLLSQSSVIYDINGNIVDNIYSGTSLRTNVEYNEIPQDLINAFVSIEDKTFWTHPGFNFIRIGGAIWEKISGKTDRIGGTSTITQQLARNIFLTSEKGERKLSRKIREAYYTIIIERTLSKEQIIEAYLNTVYLGFNSDGVSAAARAYFNKELKDLNLIECAQLAALPKSPNAYAPLKRVATESVEDIESLDVVAANDNWITYYNDTAADRIKLVLRFMHEQGKIDDATYEIAKEDSIRNYLNPGVNIGSAANDSSYFSDYIASRVIADLQTELGYSYQDAYDLLHKGGLIVNSTMDMQIQTILEDAYNDPNTFPKISLNSVSTDKNKNIVNNDNKEKVILYAYNSLFNEAGDFVLKSDEVKWLEDGRFVVLKGKKVNLYNVKSNGESDVRVDIKDFYEMVDGQLYSRTGCYWLVDSKYKTRDDSGNLIISAEFFTDYPDALVKTEDGGATLSSKYFVLASRIIQPQSAMVIIDNATGQVRGMVGGRGIKGELLYNRATATRQPGSSMKPLAIYSTALQLGYDAIKDPEDGSLLSTSILAEREATAKTTTKTETEDEDAEDGTHLSSKVFTAATVLDNMPFNQKYSLWPSNFDGTYGGRTTLRRAVEKSLNACAVNLYLQLDPKICIENV
ncbi:MAG: transglycosylase domain-containing protein, partial [Bacillota bacterium]|nr:transglycosylase domain-containing protein [Bacillota bacterium]